MDIDLLPLIFNLPIRALNAGLFISRGIGQHPDRIIDSYEIIFVSSGALEIYEEDREFSLHEGQTLLLRPHRKHGGVKAYPADLSFYWIHFQVLDEAAVRSGPEDMQTLEDIAGKDEVTMKNQAFQLPQWVQVYKPDQLIELFRRFLEHQESAASRSPLLSHLILMEILCMIADSNIMPANDGPSAVLASRADSYIRTHFHQNLSTIKLAEALGCNPDYLGRIYHRVYRKTLTETIHEFRIKYACQLLMDSNLNIEEVARTSGFDDSGYFRRIFKRLKGLSPTQYRHLYTLVHINTE